MNKAAKRLIWFQLFFLIFSGLLQDFGLPHAILYLLDLSNVALALLALLSDRRRNVLKGGVMLASIGLWLGYMLVCVLFKQPSLPLIVWALRNWGRGFVFFASCLVFLEREDLRHIFRVFEAVYVFNFVLVVAEFFFTDRSGDFLGGVFGSIVGCNGQTNVFMCALLIYELIGVFERKRLDRFTAFLLVSSMVIAGLEELKFYYYELPMILVAVILLYAIRGQLDRRTLLTTLAVAVLALAAGLTVIYFVFPEHFHVLIGKESYAKYEQTSRVSYRISRTKFIPEINALFFGDSPMLRLTGFGLGNCEYSTMPFLTSDFYRQYSDYNVHFFSHQPLYLEGGLIGLLLFLLIPFSAAVEHGVRLLRRRGTDRALVFGCVFALVAFVNVIYNNTSRTDIQYLTYFLLSVPYIAPGRGAGEAELTEPIRVLFVYGDTLRRGGIERFMMNCFRYIDRSRVHIDFLLQGEEKAAYEDEILSAGSRIYRAPKPSRAPIRYRRTVKRIIREGGYRVVHGHSDAMNARIMWLALVCGVPVRIAHSHNTRHILNGRVKYLFYELCRRLVGALATDRWACSEAAGRWLFGSCPFKLIPNAQELDKFLFDEAKRAEVREKLGIPDSATVLGHVGKFDYQKNQSFLVDVLEKLCERSDRDHRLLLVGDGFLRETVEKELSDRGLTERASLTGWVNDPETYYNAMDLYVMPSRFEGCCFAVEEAEANGLFCIVSDMSPGDANVEGRVRNLPLDVDAWVEAILSAEPERHGDTADKLRSMGYDIRDFADRMEREYREAYEREMR